MMPFHRRLSEQSTTLVGSEWCVRVLPSHELSRPWLHVSYWSFFVTCTKLLLVEIKSIFKSTCDFIAPARLERETFHIRAKCFATSPTSVHHSRFDKTLYACQYTTYFQSLIDVLPQWQVNVYQQNVFCWGCTGAATRIPTQEFFFFRIHANEFFSNSSAIRADFDSRCEPGFSPSHFLNGIWFRFCYRKFSDRLKRLFDDDDDCFYYFQK